jgi:transcriptional regulator with XRE-family HTH domain
MTIPETLGERIQTALDSIGMSQTDAAKALDLTRNTLGGWISGREVPERQLVRVAELSGKSCAWLRYGLEDVTEAGIERFTQGYERAIDDVREHLDRLQSLARRTSIHMRG